MAKAKRIRKRMIFGIETKLKLTPIIGARANDINPWKEAIVVAPSVFPKATAMRDTGAT